MSPTSQCVTRVAETVGVDDEDEVVDGDIEDDGDSVDAGLPDTEELTVSAGLPDTDELTERAGLPDTEDVALTADVADCVIAEDDVTLAVEVRDEVVDAVDVRDAVADAVDDELPVGLAVIDIVGDRGAHSAPALKSTPHTSGSSRVKRYVQSNWVPTSVLVVSSLMSLMCTSPSGEHANVMCAWRCTLCKQFLRSP